MENGIIYPDINNGQPNDCSRVHRLIKPTLPPIKKPSDQEVSSTSSMDVEYQSAKYFHSKIKWLWKDS